MIKQKINKMFLKLQCISHYDFDKIKLFKIIINVLNIKLFNLINILKYLSV
jgi:hypothetical protein